MNRQLEIGLRWYQKAVIYQAHVRAFYDSSGDGIGDFRGMTEKLDYVKDLGVTAIWLLPFYPSPLRDGGYDIADYRGVHPAYGTMSDFRQFVRSAHDRGLRVITELVLNHTSDQHPWFQRAREAKPGSRWRKWYVWSDSPERYAGTRIIFKDFESSNWSWDPVAKAYYWHRFYSHQPDLNWANAEVEREIYRTLDFWLNAGVDGLRLDAVPYLYEREGTTCENLPETHAALARIRKHVDDHYQDRMLLAEANQWPEDAVAYFGGGKECHMCFHFPLMPRLYMAMVGEDRFPLIDIMQQTPEIPAACQWAIFLRNHDELTLEMVTDEERDYMYRAYAANPRARINLGIRHRLAPLLSNDRRKIELLNGLLFSFNGTPIVYYGDEIGMGDNIYLGDRDGVRTPMQWSADRNAGFSTADPQQLYLPVNIDAEYRYEHVNVEAQKRNPSSLYWWMRQLIALRRRNTVLIDGTLEFLYPENHKILAFLRRRGNRTMLIVANLARSVQYAELDLRGFVHRVPREVFGRTRFPPIGEQPYLVTLGPYAFYWLDLGERHHSHELAMGAEGVVEMRSDATLDQMVAGDARDELELVLPRVLATRRWFGGKALGMDSVEIFDALELHDGPEATSPWLLLLRVHYDNGKTEMYVLPVAFLEGAEAWRRTHQEHWSVLVRVRRGGSPDQDAILVDALDLPEVRERLLTALVERKRWSGKQGAIVAVRTRASRALQEMVREGLVSSVPDVEQSNTSMNFGDKLMLKLFRRVERGRNPDLELGAHLTEQRRFRAFPEVLGGLEHVAPDEEPITLVVLQRYLPNHGDAWAYTKSQLGHFFENALVPNRDDWSRPPGPVPVDAAAATPPPEVRAHVGDYLWLVELLGQRTAEMHLALGQPSDDAGFSPEPFSAHYQRSLYQSMRNHAIRALTLLGSRMASLPEHVIPDAERILELREGILARFQRLMATPLTGMRIRCHGDLHLGQVLFTGRDWAIIDFEGEPARPIGERRIKRTALRDVAGMMRSFHYVAHHAVEHEVARGAVQRGSESMHELGVASDYWSYWVGGAYLASYLRTLEGTDLLPATELERGVLLSACLLEKATYELAYELNNRPRMVGIPLAGIRALMEESA